MKRVIVILGCVALLAYLVLWVGMALNLEYPYALTLMRVRKAISVKGVPVSQIIREAGIDTSRGLHWHTCSY